MSKEIKLKTIKCISCKKFISVDLSKDILICFFCMQEYDINKAKKTIKPVKR